MNVHAIPRRLLGALVMLLLLTPVPGCSLFGGDDEEVEPPSRIDPSDADALTDALVIPNARRQSGHPPPPSLSPEALPIGNILENQTVSSGSTFYLEFTYEFPLRLAGIYMQIDGASSFFDITIVMDIVPFDTIYLPITIPANVAPGRFCTSYRAVDGQGLVSNVANACVDVRELE